MLVILVIDISISFDVRYRSVASSAIKGWRWDPKWRKKLTMTQKAASWRSSEFSVEISAVLYERIFWFHSDARKTNKAGEIEPEIQEQVCMRWKETKRKFWEGTINRVLRKRYEKSWKNGRRNQTGLEMTEKIVWIKIEKSKIEKEYGTGGLTHYKNAFF